MPIEDDDDLPGEVAAPPKKPKPEPKTMTSALPDEPIEPEVLAPKKHEHTDFLVSRAKQFGFTQRDLDNHPSNVIWEEINRIIALQQSRAPTGQAAPKEPEPEDEVEAFLKTCEDEPTAKMIRALAKRADTKDIREKLAKLDQLEAAEKARTVRAQDEAVDDGFASLPAEFKAIVGDGDMAGLTDHGARGWRNAIYGEAKITPADSPRAIKRKILEAATALAGEKVKPKKPPVEEEEVSAYKPVQNGKPRDTNGRFTAEQFEQAQIVKPNGKKTGIDQLSPVDGMRRILKEAGDPRGDRPSIDFDEDLPE